VPKISVPKVQPKPKRIGAEPKEKPNRTAQGESTRASTNAIVPFVSEFPANAAADTPIVSRPVSYFYSGSQPKSSMNTYVSDALTLRGAMIQKQFEGESVDVDLPKDVIKFTDQWLRRNHLVFSASDPEFWFAFKYILTSVESFSLEAIEGALQIVIANATDAVRRNAAYSELRSLRELRKIKDCEIKARVSKVLADRLLLSDEHLVRAQADRQKEKREKIFLRRTTGESIWLRKGDFISVDSSGNLYFKDSSGKATSARIFESIEEVNMKVAELGE
jgi:hypothetical protein